MIGPVNTAAIRPVADTIQLAGAAGAKPAEQDPFGAVFQDAVARVQAFRDQSHLTTERFLNGEQEEIHKVALDAQRAEIAFDFFLQSRNKVVQAYQEIMRMPL